MGWLSAPLCGVCHTTCSSSAFLTAATVSFIQLHSTAPHPFHCTMLTAILLHQGLASCRQTQPKSGRMHSPFHKPAARFTWLHSTTSSLFHFSRLQSTRCQFLFCSPAAPLRLRSPCGCYCSFVPHFAKHRKGSLA